MARGRKRKLVKRQPNGQPSRGDGRINPTPELLARRKHLKGQAGETNDPIAAMVVDKLISQEDAESLAWFRRHHDKAHGRHTVNGSLTHLLDIRASHPMPEEGKQKAIIRYNALVRLIQRAGEQAFNTTWDATIDNIWPASQAQVDQINTCAGKLTQKRLRG